MSSAPSPDVEALRAKYARDVNCLVDEDRNKRRRALTTFSAAATSLTTSYVLTDLLPTLLRVVAVSVEKNRELAVTLVTTLCLSYKDAVPAIARHCIPVLSARVGSVPFPESTEEIRLLLVQLLTQFLVSPACADVVRDNFATVVEVLVRLAGDAYHDVKVRSSRNCRSWRHPADRVSVALPSLGTFTPGPLSLHLTPHCHIYHSYYGRWTCTRWRLPGALRRCARWCRRWSTCTWPRWWLRCKGT